MAYKDDKVRLKAVRDERRAKHICVRCGKHPAAKSNIKGREWASDCEGCLAARRPANLERFKRTSKACDDLKICRYCKDREPMPGMSVCGVCSEEHEDKRQQERARNRESGLCACGNPVKEGTSRLKKPYRTCLDCISKSKRAYQGKAQRNYVAPGRRKQKNVTVLRMAS